METTKPAKHKGTSSGTNFTKYLPRATTFTVPSRPFSPGRSSTAATDTSRPQHAGHGHHHRSSFSGPISIIPVEARQRRPQGVGGSAAAPVEPTSPKVSCMGQVKKHKDAAKKKQHVPSKAKHAEEKKLVVPPKAKHGDEKKPAGNSGAARPPKFVLMKFLRTKSSRSRAEEDKGKSVESAAGTGAAAAPSLGQLRRFSSGRSALAGFDWKSGHVAPVDLESPVLGQGGDEDGFESYGMVKADDDDDAHCRIPHSAPMVLGGGIGFGGAAAAPEPKKQQEVNLWKRRTMPPPKPLQLNGNPVHTRTHTQ